MIYYGKFKDDGILRIRTEGNNVSSCIARERVPDHFGIIPNAIHCDTGKHITLIRVDP